jgi:hypothetical protein
VGLRFTAQPSGGDRMCSRRAPGQPPNLRARVPCAISGPGTDQGIFDAHNQGVFNAR